MIMTNYDSFLHCHLTETFFAIHVAAKELTKFFCVLQFSKTESVISVQRAFQRRFVIAVPSAKNIRSWYKQFEKNRLLG